MAAPAHVITVGIDPGLVAAVRAWFLQFNFLPPIPLTAVRVDAIPAAHANFVKLFHLMAASPHDNFILIIHGNDEGAWLWLKLLPRQKKNLTSHFDVQRLLDLAAGGAELSPHDQAIMGITQSEGDQIVEAMRRLHAKKINCVEFRSCNLGRNRLSLDRFRRFFGARRAGAPNLHTFFGIGPVLLGPNALEYHWHLHRGRNWETYNFPEAYKAPSLVCCFQLNRLQKPEAGGHIAADGRATLAAWIKKYVMPTGAYRTGEMALHGLWIADRVVPADHRGGRARLVPAAIETDPEALKTPLGGWGGPIPRRMIPPLSEFYRRHIVYAP